MGEKRKKIWLLMMSVLEVIYYPSLMNSTSICINLYVRCREALLFYSIVYAICILYSDDIS